MYTLLPYMYAATYLGFVTRSAGWATLIYVMFHFCFWIPVFGVGMVSYLEATTFYSLAFIIHAIVGQTLAWALNAAPLVIGLPIPMTPCEKHDKMIFNPLGVKNEQVRGSKAFGFAVYLYRFALGTIVLLLLCGSAMAFEYIPPFLSWLAIMVTMVGVVFAHLVFWAAFTKHIAPHAFKELQSPYRVKDSPNMCEMCGSDMTHDIVFYLALYYITTTLVFCIVYILVPFWWQFYTSVILFGAFELFYLLGAVWWMRGGIIPRGNKHKL